MANNRKNNLKEGQPHALAPYEKVRSMTIEKNAQKFRDLGLFDIAQQMRDKNKRFAKGKENVNCNQDDQDYVPENDHDSNDDEVEISRVKKVATEATTNSAAKSIPKKVLLSNYHSSFLCLVF